MSSNKIMDIENAHLSTKTPNHRPNLAPSLVGVRVFGVLTVGRVSSGSNCWYAWGWICEWCGGNNN